MWLKIRAAMCQISKECNPPSMTVKQLFQSRKLFQQATSLMVAKRQFSIRYKNCGVYCGYDPTASSLHLGNLVSIIMMARLSLLGFKPIFVVGGATGLIGDPSGKNKQRVLLAEQTVLSYQKDLQLEIATIYESIFKHITINHAKYEIPPHSLKLEYKIINNYDYYKNVNCIEFLRDVGKYFRMSALLSKETVAKRLQSEQGMSFTQFSYAIMQAHDFYMLYKQENCVMQIGGSDQYGNITNGCDLVRKKLEKEVFGVTMPLLTNKNGEKFGKSEGNALYLNQNKTPKYDMHQYLLNVADDEVERMLLAFTFYSQNKIKQIMIQHTVNKEKRYAQNVLIQCVLSYLGGYEMINNFFFTLKHQELIQVKEQIIKKIFSKMQKQQPNSLFLIQKTIIQKNIIQIFQQQQLMKKAKKSLNGMIKDIEAGGVYINNKKITKEESQRNGFLAQNLLYQKYVFVRWGKKSYQFIQINKQ